MSALKPGTLCVIIAGCPENIGLVVEVIQHLGHHEDREDAYFIRTATGRPFHQMWSGNDLLRGHSSECITDRHKLRPLVDSKDDTDQDDVEFEKADELVTA
jgi:hypothetical protein